MTFSWPNNEAFERAAESLGWPSGERIFVPTGPGVVSVTATARAKITPSVKRLLGLADAAVGVLTANPESETTEPLLGIVVSVSRLLTSQEIGAIHRLAWNFCHAPLLIIVEPHLVRTWSCFLPPVETPDGLSAIDAQIKEATWNIDVEQEAAEALKWASLIDGTILEQNKKKFNSNTRADKALLSNLVGLRKQMLAKGLDVDLAHDLLSRLLFIQFLADRKDEGGKAALDAEALNSLWEQGVLQEQHSVLASIFQNVDESYRLFDWLNVKFNGDFFPAKSESAIERKRIWDVERNKVERDILPLLAAFTAGDVDIITGQRNFWRLYSFDIVPLEFISCIYEEFVSTTSGVREGVHYTPVHLADYLLDAVLPWTDDNWNLKILDPCCGSGIFLVRAFQRLSARWRQNNRKSSTPPDVLCGFLKENLCGVEVNPHAVKVASFSLYLALCDELQPRDLLNLTFPSLINQRIVNADFFSLEADKLLREFCDHKEGFDIVCGNAPWGKATITQPAKDWAKRTKWPMSNKDIGSIFVPRSFEFLKPSGGFAMIQSAGMLFNQRSEVVKFRERLFSEFKVLEVTNLSILRKTLFPTATSSAIIVVASNDSGGEDSINYIVPKLLHSPEDGYRISVDMCDIHEIHPWEVADPLIWTSLTVGSRRDYLLAKRLLGAGQNLAEMVEGGEIAAAEGVIPSAKGSLHTDLNGRKFLQGALPKDGGIYFDSSDLPVIEGLKTHRKTAPSVFDGPQILVRQSYSSAQKRFRAVYVNDDNGVVCTQSLLSVTGKKPDSKSVLLRVASFLNSKVAAYLLCLSSHRMLFNQEVTVDDILSLPIPLIDKEFDDANEIIFKLFDFSPAERRLVDNLLSYAVPELLRDAHSAGRASTLAASGHDDVVNYAKQLVSAFPARRHDGDASMVEATVYQDHDRVGSVRLLCVRVYEGAGGEVNVQKITSESLLQKIDELDAVLQKDRNGSVNTARRSAVIFSEAVRNGKVIPAIYIVKPDQARYWSTSQALHDVDSLAVSLLIGPHAFNSSYANTEVKSQEMPREKT